MELIRVLIVEDDFRVAHLNREFTERIEGFTVVGVAGTGNEALQLLRATELDLVLLDEYVPELSGSDLLREIRRKQLKIDVIFITAAKEIDTVQSALRGGALEYIIKPFTFERFQETLIAYRQYRRELSQRGSVGQREVDQLFQKLARRRQREIHAKGIDPATLRQVRAIVAAKAESEAGALTAERVGRKLGASRTTARRYLEYLVAEGELETTISYGTVGRPERKYIVRGLKHM